MSSSTPEKIEFLDGNTEKGKLEVGSDYVELTGPDSQGIKFGTFAGASAGGYVTIPFFEGAGKSSVGEVKLIGNGPKAGLTWSGGYDATWSFDLGNSLAEISSDIIPSSDDTYDLGSSTNAWSEIFAETRILLTGSTSDRTWVRPDVNEGANLGSSTYSFYQMFANLVRYKDLDSFESHDDIELIKNIKEKEIEINEPDEDGVKQSNKKIKKMVWDINSMPKETNASGFHDAGAVNGLIIGALKQLINKVEKLETKLNNK